jgi:histidine ammonia-lyase
MQEDHVSMGWGAARKLRVVVESLARIIAIETITAARGIELRAPLAPAPATGAALEALRRAGIPGPGPDRFLAPELACATGLVRDGELLAAVQSQIGELR